MTTLVKVEDFRETEQLMTAICDMFAKGNESIAFVKGDQIVGTLLSRDAAKRAMARRVAETWLSHPTILDELEDSLQQTGEAWD